MANRWRFEVKIEGGRIYEEKEGTGGSQPHLGGSEERMLKVVKRWSEVIWVTMILKMTI